MPSKSLSGEISSLVIWTTSSFISSGMLNKSLSKINGYYRIGSLEIVLNAIMTHPVRGLYQYGYPKEKTLFRKQRKQISKYQILSFT